MVALVGEDVAKCPEGTGQKLGKREMLMPRQGST